MPSRVFAAAAAAAFLGLAASPRAAEFDVAAPATATVATRTQAPRLVPAPRSVAASPAAKQTAAGRCTSLGQQVATAVTVHFASRKLGTARKLAEEGNEDCAHRKYSLGTRRLVEALEVLGVAPKL